MKEPEKREVLNKAPKKPMTAEDAVQNIQNIAKSMRQYSVMIKDSTKTLRESGAIPELVEAIRDMAAVVRDTAMDVQETATELKESGVSGQIARSIEETNKAAQDTIRTARDTSKQIGEAAPQTTKAIKSGSEYEKHEELTEATLKPVNKVKTQLDKELQEWEVGSTKGGQDSQGN